MNFKRTSLLLALVLGCNVSDDTVHRVAESAGLHDVRPTGVAPLSCAKGDTFRTHFEAKNSEGKKVKGTVCCGVFKDCTVRFK